MPGKKRKPYFSLCDKPSNNSTLEVIADSKKALIHFMTQPYDLISCYWSDPNPTSASDRVMIQIRIRLALFPSHSGHLIAHEIAYHVWCTPPLCRLSKIDCRLWPVKPRLPLWAQYITYFSLHPQWHHPTNADDITIIKFFLLLPAPRIIICHQFCGIFFIGASICQSVVACPSMVTMFS